MKYEIVPMTMAQGTYVAAYCRKEEREEHDALHDQDVIHTVAYAQTLGGNYTLLEDGQPTFVFGAVRLAPLVHVAQIWGIGTDNVSRRGLAEMTRFIKRTLKPELIASGVRRAEVRALASHKTIAYWLAKHLGAKKETELANYGRNGETFVQLSWLNPE